MSLEKFSLGGPGANVTTEGYLQVIEANPVFTQ